MARTTAVEMSDYERKRQETIAKNKALLRNLQLDAAQAGIAPKSKSSAKPDSSQKKRPKPAPKPKAPPVATRSSSRLKGIVADSEVAKRKAEEETEALQAAERAKRQRVSGDLNLSDILVSGKSWDAKGNLLSSVGPAQPYERTFTAHDIKKTSSKELRALREKLSGLQLWEDVEPSRIKITPERIYAMTCHPTTEKALVFAGDKLGNLGIFDSSQSKAPIKSEDDDDEEEEDDGFEPQITTLKLHSRTISSFQMSPTDPNSLFSSSYDSSIRRLDLAAGAALEIYAPADPTDDDPISGVQVAAQSPHVVHFTTLSGQLGLHDTRAAAGAGTQLFALSDKKIGGFSLHPAAPQLVATASLDRTVRLWDLRKIAGGRRGADGRAPALLGSHESRLSVSHAAFNAVGQLATASYDDTVKIYDFSAAPRWAPGEPRPDDEMQPTTVVPHNNQTGRWVTILRAQWQANPSDGIQRFAIGNMNRFVDVYAGDGSQLAQLGGEGITAVPAVAVMHPSVDWVVAGTASGKLCLWM